MFELTDTILERIIFAMEDQSKSFLVDCADGELVAKEELLDADREKLERLVPPPEWHSGDGFKMMELYAATTRNPELKAELSQALSQGKKVFKTFKEILSAWPNAEKSFLDFKTKYMRRRIQAWLNDIREANGLSRLPGEPEETEDLLLADFFVSVEPFSALSFDIAPIIEDCCMEGRGELATALISTEKESLLALVRDDATKDAGLAAWIPDDKDRPLGLALGVMENHGGHALARIRFIHVRSGYRGLGISALLLDTLVERFKEKNVFSVYLDSLLVPAEYGQSLQSSGFDPVGIHCFIQSD